MGGLNDLFKKKENNNHITQSTKKHVNTGFIAVIITQYLLTLASAFVAIVFRIVDTNAEADIKLATQILIALSSNCCSVACTLSFINRNDEYDSFQPSRTIIIVLSLVINIILTLIFQYGLLQIPIKKETNLLMLMGVITCLLTIRLIGLQKKVESTNTNTFKTLIKNQETQAKIAESKITTTANVNGVEYNVGD